MRTLHNFVAIVSFSWSRKIMVVDTDTCTCANHLKHIDVDGPEVEALKAVRLGTVCGAAPTLNEES